MSHELTIHKSGKVEMAYVGETPWHGLGEELQSGQPIEVWSKAAGMDWRKILRTKPVEPIARMACDNTTLHADIDGANGTVYGWLNAVTEYTDHSAVTRGDNKVDNRLDSAWFGRGADVKERAFDMATAVIENDSRNPVAAVNDWLVKFR